MDKKYDAYRPELQCILAAYCQLALMAKWPIFSQRPVPAKEVLGDLSDNKLIHVDSDPGDFVKHRKNLTLLR